MSFSRKRALLVAVPTLLAAVITVASQAATSENAPSASTAAPSPRPVALPLGEGAEPYSLQVEDWEGPAGEEGYVLVVLEAKHGHKINLSYPQRVKLDAPPSGLTLPQRSFGLDDAQKEGDKRLVFTIPTLAEQVGSYQLRGQVKLSVCSADQCRVAKQPLSARVTAQ